jgi:DNA-binding transcriptional LysR family regulator
MSFTLRQLSYFVAAGETCSITLASQRVNISQPAISAAISQLEEELGTQLFVRHHAQGLSLTSAGRSLLREAHLLLRQADGLYAAAADLQRKPSGEMSVGWFSTLAPLLMPALVRSFTESYPGTTVRSQVSHQADLLAALRRADIDVAITYDLLLSVDISFTPLVDLPPYAIVGANHPLATRASVSLKAASISCRCFWRSDWNRRLRSRPNIRTWFGRWWPMILAMRYSTCGPSRILRWMASDSCAFRSWGPIVRCVSGSRRCPR